MSSWAVLKEELDRWSDAGLEAQFWWRDDDAASDSRSLDLLLRYAAGIPLAMATIPDQADETLAGRLASEASVTVLQHGWRHQNHALTPPDSEYPPGRDAALVLDELRTGGQRLRSLFGTQAIPVFVPPWHGFHDSYLPLLREAALKGLSSKGPRPARAIPDLVQVNIHCVPIEWTSPPMFGDEAKYIQQICDHLENRRNGLFDPDEPTGILTHHLFQDAASYAFMSRLSETIATHPPARWIGLPEILGLA